MSGLSNIRAGEVIAGKYVVERLLGEGGMGIVVVAMHTQLEQKVAIKFLRPEALDNAEAVSRFVREARAAARIQSEHVVRVYDVSTLEGGAPYLVMEHLDGRDLDATIRAHGPVPLDVAATYMIEACEALAQAHKAGIVHRDLKPANLFLAQRADGSLTVKILDFGISKLSARPGAATEVSMTRTSAVMGSPLYMAPEQMRSTRAVDHRADIWSLGIILYEALAGGPPFIADTLTEVCAMILTEAPPPIAMRRANLPPELERIILRCLEKQPENRFADVAELAAALAPFAPPELRRKVDGIVRIVHGAAGLSGGRPSMPISALAGTIPHSAVGSSSQQLIAASVTGSSSATGPGFPAAPVLQATGHAFGSTDRGAGGAGVSKNVLWGVIGLLGVVVVVGGGFGVHRMVKGAATHDTLTSASAPSATATSVPTNIAADTVAAPSASAIASSAPTSAASSASASLATAPKNVQSTTTPTQPKAKTTTTTTKPVVPKATGTSSFGGRE